MSNFKINILTGTDAQSKYDAITTKDENTIYLLKESGIGYYNNKKIFDATQATNTVDTIDEDNPSNNVPTESAIVSYVQSQVSDKVPYEINGEPGTESNTGSNSGTSSGVNLTYGDYRAIDFQVGTYTNGKPLYRFCTQYSVLKGYMSSINMDKDIETVVKLDGIVFTSDGNSYSLIPTLYPTSFVSGTVQENTLFYSNSAKKIYYSVGTKYFTANTDYFVLIFCEYTKTTD